MDKHEIFQKVADIQSVAVLFHYEMMEYFGFLNLPGYRAMHFYQLAVESEQMLKTRDYFFNYDGTLLKINPTMVQQEKCIPDDWRNYKRTDVNKNFVVKSVKAGMQKYLDWENWAHSEYCTLSRELYDMRGYVDVAEYVTQLAKNAQLEVKKVTSIMIELEVTDYDIVHIFDCQKDFKNKYKLKNTKFTFDF